MYQLIYYSKSTFEGAARELLEDLRKILATARAKNKENMVTGYLVFDWPWFVQILEGDLSNVHATYERIKLDPRHAGTEIIQEREVVMRQFPDWSMGGSIRNMDVQEIFLRHGMTGPIDPSTLDGHRVVNLCLDLMAREQKTRPAS